MLCLLYVVPTICCAYYMLYLLYVVPTICCTYYMLCLLYVGRTLCRTYIHPPPRVHNNEFIGLIRSKGSLKQGPYLLYYKSVSLWIYLCI